MVTGVDDAIVLGLVATAVVGSYEAWAASPEGQRAIHAMNDAVDNAANAVGQAVKSMCEDKTEVHLYHRLQSPTQTYADGIMQVQSGQMWGREAYGSSIPTVKAYVGPLPAGEQGVEFTTEAEPNAGAPQGQAKWYPGSPGVTVNSQGYAVINVTITKNTQVPE